MKKRNLLSCIACVLLLSSINTCTTYGQATATKPAAETPTHVATTAVSRGGWWMKRHAQKMAEKAAMKQVDLVMIGDSITHGWDNRKQGSPRKKLWDTYYTSRNALNLGFSGDRTEHVLWRLDNGEMDDISPKLVTIMIGTNNIGHGSSTPAQTIDGIKAILARLRKEHPQSKILLQAVFPRGATKEDAKRKQVTEINAGLPALADDKHIFYIDIAQEFLDEEGNLPKSIMPDLLHPNDKGYLIWAEAIEPMVKKLMHETK